MLAHAGGKHIAGRQKAGAAMVIDNAFRLARGARRIVQRNRIPFIARHFPSEIGAAFSDEAFIFLPAQAFAMHRFRRQRILHFNDDRLRRAFGECGAQHRHEFAVHNHGLGLTMIKDIGDGWRIQARIDGVQDSTRHGHAVMAFQHFRDIRQNGRNRIARLNAALGKRMGKLHATIAQAGVIALDTAMHHGRIIRINLRGAFQKQQRRQRLMIGRIAIQRGFVFASRHILHLSSHCGWRFSRKAPMPSAASRAIRFSVITEAASL